MARKLRWARANLREQNYQTHTLLTVFRAWQALREKTIQLQEALEESKAKQLRLNQRHEALAAQVEKDKKIARPPSSRPRDSRKTVRPRAGKIRKRRRKLRWIR